MNSITDKWCGQFKKCNGCKLQSECMVKPEEMVPIFVDGKMVDKWAIRTTKMIERELAATDRLFHIWRLHDKHW